LIIALLSCLVADEANFEIPIAAFRNLAFAFSKVFKSPILASKNVMAVASDSCVMFSISVTPRYLKAFVICNGLPCSCLYRNHFCWPTMRDCVLWAAYL
ncbi:hypothetical protein L9F63_016451, partial [Diploptera punctata]